MRKNLITIVIFFFLSINNTQAQQPTESVKLILLEASKMPPSCGILSWAKAYKCKLLSGKDRGKIIIGFIMCPDSYEKILKKSAKFNAELVAGLELLKVDVILNDYNKTDYPKYTITRLTTIN
ncbi:hypothetical protein DVR12_26480 [Chitinophaga silvatica]|uniref:Uncharacterized protein n=1 Tax=Chitinophaga silvatica TaxID=2282649 RepID=A0A3E1Y2M0_9BACT|nr:hypothetical protein [Chitinophaga silvatica]RFS18928.1 hypothetical protein DVR12_26480 [Chitinophaga silvatica]